MIPLPRLLNSDMQEIARLAPVSLSIDLYMSPLSTATMVLGPGQPTVNTGDFIELFTASGSAGIFRVQQTADDVDTRTISLEHGLVTLSDSLIPGETDKAITSTVTEAFNALLANQSRWELGTVAIPDEKTISWEYDYSALLDSVLSIMDRFPDYRLTFDQSGKPWKLNIDAVPTETASECRLTRNILSLSVDEDFSEICTRLYIPNRAEPLEADTLPKWGAVTRRLAGDEGLTEAELLAYGQRYLDTHKNPALTISIDAVDLSTATGESMDAFHLGYLCRVCLPDYGQTITQRITALSWPDVYGEPEKVSVTLANAAENTATALSSLLVDTTVQRRLIYKNGQELDRLIVRTIANENQIDIITPQLDILTNKTNIHANEILNLTAGVNDNKARITITEDKVEINAKEISLKASNADLNDLETTFTISSDGVRSAIQDGDKTIAELNSTVNGLEHWVTDADGNISTLTNTVRGMESKVEAATGEVSTLTNTAEGMTSTIHGQGEALSQLKTRIDEISATVKDTDGNVGKLIVTANSVASRMEDTTGKLKALTETTDEHFISLQGDITEVDGKVTAIEGSSIWQTRDNITAAVGTMYVDDDGNLHIKDGSGLVVDRGSASLGVYDSGNLTAGVLVQKLNDGTTSTKIKADVIELDGKTIATMLDGNSISTDGFSAVDAYIQSLETDFATSGQITTEKLLVASEMYYNGEEVATKSWANDRFYTRTYCDANFATFTHLSTNYALKSTLDDYQLASGLTTKTVTVMTGVSYNTATTPPFYSADGLKVNDGVTYVTGVSKTTQGITFVVYA